MNNNLILVYPQKITQGMVGDISLALLYLAGAARDSGVCDNIKIFDFNAPVGKGKTFDDLMRLIDSLSEGQTVIGINCLYSALFPSVREIAVKVKKRFPNIKVVTGGMHPTLFAEEIIEKCPEIDAVAIGEADADFPKLLSYYYNKGDINDIEGFCLRVEGETIVKPKTQYIHDLDSLPRPGYEFYDFSEYEVDTSNWWDPDQKKISSFCLPILTSRSCPNQCNFCAMWLVMGKRFRMRSAENVFEEIKYLHDTYGVNYFKVEDDSFTLNRERAIKICKLIIESGLKVYFDARNGLFLKTLDVELVGLMRQAGFIMVSLAVESGCDYIRNKIIGKHLSREEIINAFKICSRAGMNVMAFFIIGLPEDTEETLLDTANLMHEIEVTRISVFAAKPLPGTRLFDQCVRDNLLTGGFDNETLWSGEAEKNAALQYEEFYLNNLLNQKNNAQQFWIKPYDLSLEKLSEIDLELQKIVYKKTNEWVEHIRKNKS